MSDIELVTELPPAPRTIVETGVPVDLVQQLIYKMLQATGELTGVELAGRLGVNFSVIEDFLETMKRDRHVAISGGAVGHQSYTFRLTEAGHARARGFAEHSAYVGQVPVPLNQYIAYMKELAKREFVVTREAVRKAFSHLVLSDVVLDRLGPAVAARHSLFLYGPPGNGKTVISQAIGNLLLGDMAIPYAISIGTEVIRFFDPVNHVEVRPAGTLSQISNPYENEDIGDRRWVHCRRPVITVGGELTMDSLDLAYSQTGGFYRAPLQALANGGVFVIDDFGRQRISPRELLNRWIVPLESRIDHLALESGQKFELPFDVLVVFATNLNPFDLVDESFLRRIRYKVYAESPTLDEYAEIFERICRANGVPYHRETVEVLVQSELQPRNAPMRGCQPRDLIEHALNLATYMNRPRQLSSDLLSAACASYFLAEMPPTSNI
jgi:predicted ATPase with chaperone activity